MALPEITVEIQHPVWIDDLPEDVYGIVVRMQTTISPSGEGYAAFLVDSLDNVDESYVDALVDSLAKYDCFGEAGPGVSGDPEDLQSQWDRLSAREQELKPVIEAELQEALAGAA